MGMRNMGRFEAEIEVRYPVQEDFFVHYSNIESGGGFRSLADGEEVEFDVEEDAKNGKKYCVRVTGIGGAPVRGTSRPRPDQE
ncbi:unnamed protein product [Effrenium voratum]|nr:unnamed protein product [Effrenium voratum]